ncbi:NAD(P)/FAD-dependent oxidoreductase [Nocardia brasiliensis]|uniref:NAD(P)/FAD-dependent oxidoreductase n=1 Tax=Nocardia brasiliensis TaxID=37326 RepID=UPI0007C5C247|nr:FAD-dependent monooxygenase [Nocardia brasiliensis]
MRTATAVVLGCGIAGLLAAAAACRHFDRVLIIERDDLPAMPAPRRGTPQSDHVHALTDRGRREISLLVPGFDARLAAAGAVTADFAAEVAIHGPAGRGAQFCHDLVATGATRELLEWVLRTEICRPPVSLAAGTVATGLVMERDSVRAVRVSGAVHGEIEADLVIDATGRVSRVDRWLTESGYPAPTATIITAGLGYASRLYRIPFGHNADWRACYIQAIPPQSRRGGVLMPVEGDRWLVTLIGAGHDRPTHNEELFEYYARSLSSPMLADAIGAATALTPVKVSTSTTSRRNRLERLRRQPANLVRVGDAVVAFNPVYAQGMTAAALAAALLDRHLEYHVGGHRFAMRYHQALLWQLRWPWLMAATADRRWLTADPSPLHRYLDRVQACGTRDRDVQRVFLETLQMRSTPAKLFVPSVAARVLRDQWEFRTRRESNEVQDVDC